MQAEGLGSLSTRGVGENMVKRAGSMRSEWFQQKRKKAVPGGLNAGREASNRREHSSGLSLCLALVLCFVGIISGDLQVSVRINLFYR